MTGAPIENLRGGASISYENVNRLINFVMLIGVPTPQITFKP